ncbi:MAG: hypothetical protein KA954_12015 [Chitinophagales bacterium]|nr:hypothetical protein [Chitinophagales bacterium]MBP8754169.1 hypothetical protein [Chitinophagales bacterium]MBP9704647.1 hypothetical protein [Chitinophagales bacterium]
MKYLFTILFFISINANAQLITTQSIVKYSLVFVSGAADGVNQTLWYHYDNFKRVHPGANDEYWNPYISSNNMNNSTLWSRTIGRGFQDGNHATRWFERNPIILSGAFTIISNGDNWWGYVFDFVTGVIVRAIGFHLTYSIIYHE